MYTYMYKDKDTHTRARARSKSSVYEHYLVHFCGKGVEVLFQLNDPFG